MNGYRLGFDIGGTFTDFVLIDGATGAVHTYKTLTTAADPSQAVREGWQVLLGRVGIAGSDEKCAWLLSGLGFDAAINYKRPDWKERLAAATPKGIDIDFENVGGEIMRAVLGRMNLNGRVVLCGLISSYTKEEPALGSFATILMKRLRVQGFIVLDYAPRYKTAARVLGKWKLLGKLKDRETVVDGLEKAPEAINMLLSGGNTGKLIVKL